MIVVPVRNREKTTLAFLAALAKAQPEPAFPVMIVDDASTDQTVARIRERFPDVTIVPGTGDLWWGGAIELGLRKAYEAGADIFFLINDDCVPEAGTLAKLAQAVRSDPTIIALAHVHSRHTQAVELNQDLVIGREGERDLLNNSTGQCVAFSRKLLDVVGFPDTREVRHYVDGVFFPQARRHGFKIYRLRGAYASCDWGAYRVLPPYIRWLRMDLSFVDYLSFVLFHRKSRYEWRTRLTQMRTRHGWKAYGYFPLRYGILFMQSFASFFSRCIGRSDKRFMAAVNAYQTTRPLLYAALCEELEAGQKMDLS